MEEEDEVGDIVNVEYEADGEPEAKTCLTRSGPRNDASPPVAAAGNERCPSLLPAATLMLLGIGLEPAGGMGE